MLSGSVTGGIVDVGGAAKGSKFEGKALVKCVELG